MIQKITFTPQIKEKGTRLVQVQLSILYYRTHKIQYDILQFLKWVNKMNIPIYYSLIPVWIKFYVEKQNNKKNKAWSYPQFKKLWFMQNKFTNDNTNSIKQQHIRDDLVNQMKKIDPIKKIDIDIDRISYKNMKRHDRIKNGKKSEIAITQLFDKNQILCIPASKYEDMTKKIDLWIYSNKFNGWVSIQCKYRDDSKYNKKKDTAAEIAKTNGKNFTYKPGRDLQSNAIIIMCIKKKSITFISKKDIEKRSFQMIKKEMDKQYPTDHLYIRLQELTNQSIYQTHTTVLSKSDWIFANHNSNRNTRIRFTSDPYNKNIKKIMLFLSDEDGVCRSIPL